MATWVLALVLLPSVARAEWSGELAVVSNYLFRGVTQTEDGPAVQAALDFESDSGNYIGVWGSNVAFGGREDVEIDLSAGRVIELGRSGVWMDIGIVHYHIPEGGDSDYGEIQLALGQGPFSASLAWTGWSEADGASPFVRGDLHYALALELPSPSEKISAALSLGRYQFRRDRYRDAGKLSYNHWGLGVSTDLGRLGSLEAHYEQNDGGSDHEVAVDGGAQFWLGWRIGFGN